MESNNVELYQSTLVEGGHVNLDQTQPGFLKDKRSDNLHCIIYPLPQNFDGAEPAYDGTKLDQIELASCASTPEEAYKIDRWNTYGNPFYLFNERPTDITWSIQDEDSAWVEPTLPHNDPHDLTCALMVHCMNKSPSQFLQWTTVPDWKVIRDNAVTVNHRHVQVLPIMAQVLRWHNHDTLWVVPDETMWEIEKYPYYGPAKCISLSQWNQLVADTRSVIKQNLAKDFSTDSALDFIDYPLEHVFGQSGKNYLGDERTPIDPDIDLAGQPKWWIQARWLNVAQAKAIRANWRNIIFLNASEKISRDVLKPTAVFQYLAQLGRITTQVFFLG